MADWRRNPIFFCVFARIFRNEIESFLIGLKAAQSTDIRCSVLQFHFNWYKILALYYDKVGNFIIWNRVCVRVCVRAPIHLCLFICLFFFFIFCFFFFCFVVIRYMRINCWIQLFHTRTTAHRAFFRVEKAHRFVSPLNVSWIKTNTRFIQMLFLFFFFALFKPIWICLDLIRDYICIEEYFWIMMKQKERRRRRYMHII